MVTAGVYLLVRCAPVFEEAAGVQTLAAWLGAVTLLAAGLIALVQTDIKRVIAYSTMSQIGYMFLGAGIAAYGSAIFHLMTHAFFKALLFMAAGMVIHHLAGEQDIRRMGGMKAVMPKTYWAFLIGSLALVGIPPLSGFFSKDAILASALAAGGDGYALFAIGLVGALLTGLYTFRMFFLVWHGEQSELVRAHAEPHAESHGPHWLVPAMGVPVGILAVLAAVGGWLQIAGLWHPFSDWLHEVAEPLVEPTVTQDWLTSLCAVAFGAVGVWFAWSVYRRGTMSVPEAPAIRRTLEHKLWFDELYDAVFYRTADEGVRLGRRVFEEPVVEGGIAELAEGTRGLASRVGLAQTGVLRVYALAIALSVAVLVVVFVSVG
jgi:NADH-quinone oxidoreductase subunit L